MGHKQRYKMTHPRLTEEQQKLVEENIRLVYFVIRKYYPNLLKGGEADDWVQIGSIGLCKAAMWFRPDVGKTFSTYAAVCIKKELWKAFTTQDRSCRKPELPNASMDRVIVEDSRAITLHDKLADRKQDPAGDAMVGVITDYVLNNYPKLMPLVVGDDVGQKETAERYGVTRQAISIQWKRMQRDLRRGGYV